MTDQEKPEPLPQEEPMSTADAADPLVRAQQDLAAVQAKAQEYLDGWRRAQADIANQRRRHEREKSELEALANARLVRQLLPIVDDFERALVTMPESYQADQWASGVTLIARKIKQIFESEGVQPIPVQPGDVFDTAIHEAMLYEEAEGFTSGQVVQELQKGYKLGERILRPALVKVAR